VVIDDSQWCEDEEDVWCGQAWDWSVRRIYSRMGRRVKKKVQCLVSERHTHFIHMQIWKECETSATNRYPTRMGSLCSTIILHETFTTQNRRRSINHPTQNHSSTRTILINTSHTSTHRIKVICL